MTKKQIEWFGCAFGLLGSFVLALNNKYSGIGFVLFLISNIFWMLYAIKSAAKGLLLMQIGFTATSLFGIYRWIF